MEFCWINQDDADTLTFCGPYNLSSPMPDTHKKTFPLMRF